MVVWVAGGLARLFVVESWHGEANEVGILDGVSFGMGLYSLEQCNAD